MANGLRKLIKRARKQYINNSNLNRRFNRFGSRLRVEELEERIAPAAGDITGTGTLVGAVMNLDSGETAILELGTDTYTLTATGGYTGDNVQITFDAGTGSATKITEIDFGSGLALDADTVLTLTSSNGTVTDTLTIDTIVDTSDNTNTVSLVGNNNTISAAMAVGTVTLNQTGITTWNTGPITTSLTAETLATSMRVGAVASGGIAFTVSCVGTMDVSGVLSGPITSALTLGATTLEAGSVAAGDITVATGNIGAITLGNAGNDGTLDFIGDITATVGSIASVSGTDETSITITGDITAGTSVGAIGTQIQTIAGTITGGTSVGAVTVLTDFTGAIEATTTVGNILVGNDLTGDITAGTTIGTITVTDGSIAATSAISGTVVGNIAVDTDSSGTNEVLAGTITATTGDIGTVTVGDATGEGDLTGTLTATAGAIGNVSVGNDISGDITAGTSIGTITALDGSITAASTILAGTDIGNIAVDVDADGTNEALAGTITATAGDIGTITIGAATAEGDLTGTVTATAGAVGNISVANDLSGDITAGTTIGTITVVDGSITAASTILAGTDIGNIAVDVDADGENEALAGTITATAGDIGTITVGAATAEGDLTGTITATAGAIGAVTVGNDISGDMTAGTTIGAIIVNDGSITAGSAITAGTDIASVTVDADEDGTNEVMAGAITATAGSIGAVVVGGGTNAEGDLTGSLTSGTSITSITVGNDITSTASITATTSVGNILVDNDLAGDISATTTIGTITTTDGSITANSVIVGGTGVGNIAVDIDGDGTNEVLAGSITATTGNIGTVTVGADAASGAGEGTFSGTLTATAGSIGNIQVGNDLTGDIAAGTNIGTITVLDGSLTSASVIVAAGTIGAISVDVDEDGTDETLAGSITSTGSSIASIDVGGDITSATLVAGTTIGSITTDGELSGDILAAGNITGTIQIDTGLTATGSIISSGGNITANTTITAGGLLGTIKATAGDIDGTITVVAGGVSGTIQAGTNIDGDVTITAGGLTGTLRAATGNLAGNLLVTAGGIGAAATITAGADIDGNITATTGDIPIAITAAVNIDGTILADAGAITGTITATTGDITGTVQADVGDVTAVVVGNDLTGTISAEDDITSIVVGNDITGATITADSDSDSSGDVKSVIAGGQITGTITGQNIDLVQSGGVAGDDITATITADADIDLINAGAADITGTMTATVATAASPLATFIDGGISYAVWAVNTGTTTTDTGVTAKVEFNGTEMKISNLTGIDANNDLLITTRQSTGAQQTLADADVDVIDAPITITITAASAVTVNTIRAEGSVNLDTLTNITATTVIVEGGVRGTATPAAGESLNYGSIAAEGLTINVVGAGTMGDLVVNDDILGDVTITGGIGRIIVGESGTGQTGDIDDGADITVTGALGGLTVDGNVNGSVSATTIGNVQIGGNLGNAMGNNESITATTGNIGNIFVGGTIGADVAGQTISIVSTTGSVGNIVAAGNIGVTVAATGTTIITAATNVGDVKSISGDVGDADSPVVVTATAGTIGTVSAGGSYGINGTITAHGNITAVTATYDDGGESTPDDADEGIVTGTITSIAGNIGTVSTVEADISAAISATSGNINAVTVLDGTDADTILNTGDVSGDIKAGGDVDTVAGAAISGDTSATLGTTGSPVTTWTAGNVTYTLEATAGPIHNYTYTGGAVPSLTDTIDNWDGAAKYTTSAIDLKLTTTAVDTDGATILSDAQFNLASLDFDNDTVTNAGNIMGTVLVEGDVTGGIDLGKAGSMANLIVEGDVAVPVRTASVRMVSVGAALGVPQPTLAELEAMFIHPTAGTVIFAVPANGTLTVPLSDESGGIVDDISIALGNGTNLSGLTVLTTGNVDTAFASQFVLTIAGGAITGIDGTGNVADGNVIITGDLAYMLYGTDLGDVNISGSITSTGGIRANNIGAITVGTVGVLTSGDMAGVISSTDVTDGAFAALNGVIGDVTILGDLSGSIYADSTIGAIEIGQEITAQAGDQATGSFTGSILARGNIDSITAQIDIGGSGIIMTGGSILGDVTATDGDVTADIFTGGEIGTITGVNFGGDWLFGALAGATTVTIVDKADQFDAGITYTLTTGAAAMVDIDADTGITATGLTIDSVTLFADSAALTGTRTGGVTINISKLLIIENSTAALSVALEGTLGDVIAADGNTAILNSNTLAANFLSAYNTEEGTTVTGDIVTSANLPSDLDVELNDDETIALTLSEGAAGVRSIGSVVASGDLTIGVTDIASIGDIISLSGNVALGTIHASTSVGSIVASENITGDIICEGPVAIGTVINLSGYGTAISGGVPSWFTGGIISEAGDIDIDIDAVNDDTALVGTTGLIGINTGYAVGGIYALTGDVDGTSINAFGNIVGIQAPFADPGDIDFMNVEGSIDFLIMPNHSAVTGVHQDATIQALNDEIVVTENNSYNAGDTAVEVSGGVAAIVDNNNSSDISYAIIERITVVGLGAVGTTMDVAGDVTQLDVIGNLAGTITVSGIDADTENAEHPVNGEVTYLNVSGAITATAGFSVYNYGDINAEGGIAPSLVETGTLSKADRIKTVGNTSMYLKGGGSTEADYEALFGKVTGVVLSGNGSATLVAVEGSVTTVSEFNDIIKDAQAGNLPAGSANIGDVVVNSSKLQLKNMVVQGDVDSLSTAGKINGLFVSGDVDWLHASKINNVEINGNVNTVVAYETAKISIAGNVESFSAHKIINVDVFGRTTLNGVTLTGTSARMVNSVFSLGSLSNTNVIGINNLGNGNDYEVKDTRGWAKVIRSTC